MNQFFTLSHHTPTDAPIFLKWRFSLELKRTRWQKTSASLVGALLMFLAIPQPWPLSLGG